MQHFFTASYLEMRAWFVLACGSVEIPRSARLGAISTRSSRNTARPPDEGDASSCPMKRPGKRLATPGPSRGQAKGSSPPNTSCSLRQAAW